VAVNAPQPLPSIAGDAGTFARQLLRLIGPGRQAPDGSLAAADALGYGATLADSRQMLLDTAEEAFPSLANDLLAEWESLLGVPSDSTLSDADRQAILVAHTRALLGASPQAIDSAVSAYTGSCVVAETNSADVYASDPHPTADTRRGVFLFAVIVPIAYVESARRLAQVYAIVNRMRPSHTQASVTNGVGVKVETADHLVEITAIGS
jgi:hypothetical protein